MRGVRKGNYPLEFERCIWLYQMCLVILALAMGIMVYLLQFATIIYRHFSLSHWYTLMS